MIGKHHAAKRSRADSGQFYHPHPIKNRRLQMAVNTLRTAHLMSVPAAQILGIVEAQEANPVTVTERRAKSLKISESTAFAKPTLPHYRVPPTTFYRLFASV
jgi:hypothetical protein